MIISQGIPTKAPTVSAKVSLFGESDEEDIFLAPETP